MILLPPAPSGRRLLYRLAEHRCTPPPTKKLVSDNGRHQPPPRQQRRSRGVAGQVLIVKKKAADGEWTNGGCGGLDYLPPIDRGWDF
jgi:hypothetical protein